MKHFLDSGNRELAASLGEPRTDDNGKLVMTHVDDGFPEIGYSDPFTWFQSGNMKQIRLLFFNGEVVGQEVTYFPWNILQPVTFHYEIEVDENYNLGDVVFGKKVRIGSYDENCIAFMQMPELIEYLTSIN